VPAKGACTRMQPMPSGGIRDIASRLKDFLRV